MIVCTHRIVKNLWLVFYLHKRLVMIANTNIFRVGFLRLKFKILRKEIKKYVTGRIEGGFKEIQ